MSLVKPKPPSAPPVDPRAFRDVLGRFVTGVTMVTTVTGDGTPLGVTINSFTSLSLEPPLVLFCLGRDARTLPLFLNAGVFAVNVLAADQAVLCERFARTPDDWTGVATETWETGAPILTGALSALDCTLASAPEQGDHSIMIGQVLRLGVLRDTEPLAYYRGAFHTLTPWA
jgi:flavin reductase (DIM6/NTAB) family NADH-FMN oxidoreductase RutF